MFVVAPARHGSVDAQPTTMAASRGDFDEAAGRPNGTVLLAACGWISLPVGVVSPAFNVPADAHTAAMPGTSGDSGE